MTKRSYKQVTKKDYNEIKSYLTNGIPASRIHRVTGRSSSTIGWIRRTSDFKDYQKQLHAYLETVQAKRIGKIKDVETKTPEVSVVAQAIEQNEKPLDLLRKINANLEALILQGQKV